MALVKLTILNLKKVQKDTSPYIEIKLSISAFENIKNAQLSLGKKEEDTFLTLSKLDYHEVISPDNPVIIEQVIPFPQGATHFIFNYLTSLDKKKRSLKLSLKNILYYRIMLLLLRTYSL